MSTSFGLSLSSEEHDPAMLVRMAQRAESSGFDYVSVSDHFHPWVEEQGHSPFVWSILGAIAARTERIDMIVGVTCPIIRIHPAILAQATATTAMLADGRFSFGVGTGEALNEHVLGDRWPRPEVRLEMLEEAVGIIREMWKGETYDHDGIYYEVENARLFDVPAEAPPVIVSGYGPVAIKLAARLGDGFFGHGSDDEAVESFRSAGGSGPTYAQLDVCYGSDREASARVAERYWPNGAIPGQLSQDLPTWTHFGQAAQLVDPRTATDGLPHGPDVDAIVEQVRAYVANGFDHVHFHQIGPDQDSFLDAWDSRIRDEVMAGALV